MALTIWLAIIAILAFALVGITKACDRLERTSPRFRRVLEAFDKVTL